MRARARVPWTQGPPNYVSIGNREWLCVVSSQSCSAGTPLPPTKVKSRNKREKLQKAYDYLMSKEANSTYRELVKKHNKFLRQHPDPSDADRRRPLQFIETPGVECALWPTLYWCTELCETVERATGTPPAAARSTSSAQR